MTSTTDETTATNRQMETFTTPNNTIHADTICAISTAPGTGGIAVVRISGPQATGIADSIWHGSTPLATVRANTATFGRVADPDRPGETLDEAVATVFRAPRSFTGEDTVEISVHGSPFIQREMINLLIRRGCRLAEPGEFTRRAFASGKIDLAQAEAIADVIASDSRGAHRIALSQMRGQFSEKLAEMRSQLLELASLLELELDFSEEDVEFADRSRLLEIARSLKSHVDTLAATFSTGDAIKRGVPVAIIGSPNVGKSSILNKLLGDNRALVSDIPGTTRDTVEDTADIEGITFRFIDTAGIRATDDPVENLGIERSFANIAKARILVWVVTATDLAGNDTTTLTHLHELRDEISRLKSPDTALILAVNKTDLLPTRDHPATLTAAERLGADTAIPLSTVTGENLPLLRHTLHAAATQGISSSANDIIVTNARHYEALRNASSSIDRVIASLTPGHPYPLPGDLIAQDVRETLHHLGSITGTITTPEILSTIFSRFCIGK